MKVTVLEDDSRLRSFLKNSFGRTDWDITYCSSLDDLDTSLMSSSHPDVLVLDRMIGSADSLNSLPAWKKQLPQTRVLFLSALDSTDEKVKALNSGADDYLAKPFSVSELEARIEALGRRKPAGIQENMVIQIGDLKIDRLAHQASVGKARLALTAKEFKLLQILSARPSVVFSKIQLMDQVWDVNAEIDSNVVEVTVRNLRRKLEDACPAVRICSQRNVGYWIET